MYELSTEIDAEEPELPPIWDNEPIATEETEKIIKILLPEYTSEPSEQDQEWQAP